MKINSKQASYATIPTPSEANGTKKTAMASINQMSGDATKLMSEFSAMQGHPLRINGTVFEFLIKDVKVWFCLSWMIFWLIMSHLGVVETREMADAVSKQVTYYVSVTSFILGFFSIQTYKSFQDQGRCAASIPGKLTELIWLLRAGIVSNIAVQQKVVRLCLAANYLFWLDIAAVLPDVFIPELQGRGLLTKYEANELLTTKAKRSAVCLMWAINELSTYFMNMKKTDEWCTSDGVRTSIMLKIQDKIFDIRGKFAELETMRSVDVPSGYSHYLWWLVMVFLTIVGFFAGVGTSTGKLSQTWILGYVALLVAYLGLFNMAMALKEPFGLDTSDLSPFGFLGESLRGCRELMNAPSSTPLPPREGDSIGLSADFFDPNLPLHMGEKDLRPLYQSSQDDELHEVVLQRLTMFADDRKRRGMDTDNLL